MFRKSLTGSTSLVRRFFLGETLNSLSKNRFSSSNPERNLALKVALCIQRYPLVSPEMTPLEKDYSDLVGQLETENSYLSDHELRKKREIETSKQKQTTTVSATGSVETVIDIEDRFVKDFEKFQFSPRITEDDKKNNVRSHNRKLDQSLLLIVKRKNEKTNQDEWIFPEKKFENETSLRSAVEKIVPDCGNLNVQISGNAPWAFYKDENDPKAKKIFFYKAELLSGAVKQFSTQKAGLFQDHAWITHEELTNYLSPSYHQAVKDMLCVF